MYALISTSLFHFILMLSFYAHPFTNFRIRGGVGATNGVRL
jgi:hypothetical protein